MIYCEDVDVSDVLVKLKEASSKYQVNDFRTDELKRDLQKDIAIFRDISKFLDRVPESRDKKIDVLLRIVQAHKGEKVLIFSEYADTVNYLHRRLKGEVENLAFVTARAKDATAIIRRFAPRANEYVLKEGESPIDVVVSTDVFSTGLNLQDCGIVVNYDLHWNPVLLIQRIGRVDRIGTEHEIIRTYNFLPHKRIDEKISLKERISRRVQEIHDYIGEDEKILDESERLNKEGAVISDIGRVLSELRCPVNEKQIPMTREDKRSLYAGLRRLEAEFKKEYQTRVELESKKDPVINKAIQKLAHFRKETKEAEDLALIDEISRVLNKGIPDVALKDLRRLERAEVVGKEYLKRLVELYNRYSMGDLKSREIEKQEYKPVELVCCELLK